MTRTTVSAMGVVFCCAVAGADDIQLPHITVYGTAKSEVNPDEMGWYLHVQNKGAEAREVAEQHAGTVAEVLEFLRQANVNQDSLTTTRMQLGVNREYRNQTWVDEGFVASTDVSFKSTDFSQYKPLWIGLSGIGGVSIKNVRYGHSRRVDLQNETRQKALAAAKDKAIAMATTLGSQIGEPLLVEEDLSVSEAYWRESFVNYFAAPRDSEAGNEEFIALGKVPIQIRVKVAFRLISP